jgi:hypothetical protein
MRPETLPGPRAFLARAAQAMARDGSLVLHLPRTPPAWLLPAIEDAVGEETGVRVIRIDAAALGGRSPAHMMAAHVMPGATRIRTVAALLAEPEVADAAFLVRGIPPEEWESWTTFRRSFDRERARLSAPLMPFLLLCAPPGPPPRLGEGLGWLGCSLRLDVETAATAIFGVPEPADLLAAVDLAVAVEVAGWDIEVLEEIAGLNPVERMDPAALCRHLAGFRPEAERTWSGGGVDLWDGDPSEHAALLARRGDAAAMAARILHGQLRVIFPFLDRVRRAAIGRDEARLAALLPFTRPWDDRRTMAEAASLEITDILLLGSWLPPTEEKFLLLCKGVRNALAHGKAAKRDDLRALTTGWRKLSNNFITICHGWR